MSLNSSLSKKFFSSKKCLKFIIQKRKNSSFKREKIKTPQNSTTRVISPLNRWSFPRHCKLSPPQTPFLIHTHTHKNKNKINKIKTKKHK